MSAISETLRLTAFLATPSSQGNRSGLWTNAPAALPSPAGNEFLAKQWAATNLGAAAERRGFDCYKLLTQA
jgi:hypothetical protein